MDDITIIHRKLVVAGLVSFTAAAAAVLLMIEETGAQYGALTRDRSMIIAQAGFTFGSRDDLGPAMTLGAGVVAVAPEGDAP